MCAGRSTPCPSTPGLDAANRHLRGSSTRRLRPTGDLLGPKLSVGDRRQLHRQLGSSRPRPSGSPPAVLIRPDGYIGWVGDGTDTGLHDAVTFWFGSP